MVGSETWALVSSSTSLVTCQDLTAANCRPTVDIIPSSADRSGRAPRGPDGQGQASSRRLRRGYAPLLDGLAATGIARDGHSARVDVHDRRLRRGRRSTRPSNVVPFPNDILRANGKVTLPNPKTFQPLTAERLRRADRLAHPASRAGSTRSTASPRSLPPSARAPTRSARSPQATIDPTSLARHSVGLAPVATQAPAGEWTASKFTPCLNCLSSKDAGDTPQTSPQQLQWKLGAPLDEKTTYLAYVTSDVEDDQGKPMIANPVFAMLRLTNPAVRRDAHAR